VAVLRSRERRVARDSAYEALRLAIVRWDFRPGDRLSEDSLAAQLGVSRTPVREALHRLEAERLVTRSAAGALSVAETSTDDVDHLYSVRAALEVVAIRAACAYATEEDFEELEAILSAMEVAVAVPEPRLVADYGREFHSYIHSMGRNALCIALLEQLRPHTDRYRALNVEFEGDRARAAFADHRAILGGLRHRDPETCASLLTDHLAAGKEVALRALNEVGKAEAGPAPVRGGDGRASPA
jgi:DNA-binding GntR family transcriptional regulator